MVTATRGRLPASCTFSSVSSEGTWSAKAIWVSVAVDPVFRVGVVADSGSVIETPSTLPIAVTRDATSEAFAGSVILPVLASKSTWPLAPVRPKRSASRSWPSCDSVPGIENESS